MLHAMSWGSYFLLLLVGLVLYYGWWVIRYFPDRRPEIKEPDASLPPVERVIAPAPFVVPGVAGDRPDVSRGKVAPESEVVSEVSPEAREMLVPAVIERPVFLPVLAGDLRNEITTLAEKAGKAAASKEELFVELRRLLVNEPYNRLKGTAFQERTNIHIVQEFEKYGSIHTDVQAVDLLWAS